jgi:S-DNA-T family DNA segregation ATPase FtsK/SpoIIIE
MENPEEEGTMEPTLKPKKWHSFLKERQYEIFFGLFLVSVSVVFLFSFYDYSVNWKNYQSEVFYSWDNYWLNKDVDLPNGTLTTKIAHFFIFNQIGIAMFLIPILFLLIGLNKFLGEQLVKIKPLITKLLFLLLWLPVTLSFIFKSSPPILGGKVGYLASTELIRLVGIFGTVIILIFFLFTFLIFGLKIRFTKEGILETKGKLDKSIQDLKSWIPQQQTEDNEEELTEDHLFSEDLKAELKAQEKSKKSKNSLLGKLNGLVKSKSKKETQEESLETENTEEPQIDVLVNTDTIVEKRKEELKPVNTTEVKVKEIKEDPFDLKIEETIKEPITQEEEKEEQPISFSLDEDVVIPTPTQSEKTEENPPSLDDDDLEIIIPEEEKIILPELEVKEEKPTFEDQVEATSESLLEKFGEFDPKLELGDFQNPPLDIMEDYPNSEMTINPEELQENKRKIVETLNNYKIDIASISATVGPTVTLYEIVPAPGVRISKIKGLENDIALSLAALGIRIIAPLPGRGTIGIEVPTKNPKIVSMKSVLMSEKFQNSTMELPVALGKTISNETFVADLAKMPHLLMAGATGQGKSVGLNAILTSLLYKKHPSELKLVLVDPKKVELTLFNHIERHYLAKLPGDGEAIITENKLVINTVNSLCVEMDARYELLKTAHCRNLKEYNGKFKKRKLNPEKGHRYLPYIVLVIDEFADLIMTAGKEIELPIARLAQLARAVGIHLIVATQRPTTNIITGTIKANFPARIAFRVTSNTDSRTILDASGANQLIGRGDMLFSNGNDITRIQCAFVDTPEVEQMCEFIGAQRGYTQAFQLPEYVGEGEESSAAGIDLNERDDKFEDAARIVVLHQQGSTSLIQRKLKLGYNRAGRIMDQLEAASIVGPFAGSKAREVLIPDEYSLEQFLDELNGNH